MFVYVAVCLSGSLFHTTANSNVINLAGVVTNENSTLRVPPNTLPSFEFD